MFGFLSSLGAISGSEDQKDQDLPVPPVFRLPNELLLRILMLALPQIQYRGTALVTSRENSRYSGHSPHVNAPPWSFTHICKHWYPLVMASPMLWSNIILPMPPSIFPDDIRLTMVQLSRSADVPLSFSLPSRMEGGETLLAALFQNCHRWKRAHLPRRMEGTNHLIAPNQTFPILESISFSNQTPPDNFPPLDHQHFPRLCSISFDRDTDIAILSPAPLVPPLVSHLSRLVLGNFGHTAIFDLLQSSAPFLHSLELSKIEATPTSANFGTIRFPQLRRLLLIQVPQEMVTTMDCPHLEEVVVESNMFSLSKSKFPLTITSAEIVKVDCLDNLLEFLYLQTNLTCLHLDTYFTFRPNDTAYKTDQLFTLLLDETTCPRLAEVFIQLRQDLRMTHQIVSFIQLIRLRAKTLRYASLHAENYPWNGYDPETREFTPHGIAVRNELRRTIRELRIENPNLRVRVEYEFERDMKGLGMFASDLNDAVTEVW